MHPPARGIDRRQGRSSLQVNNLQSLQAAAGPGMWATALTRSGASAPRPPPPSRAAGLAPRCCLPASLPMPPPPSPPPELSYSELRDSGEEP